MTRPSYLADEVPKMAAELVRLRRQSSRIVDAARIVLRWRDSVPPHGGLASDLAFLAKILDENRLSEPGEGAALERLDRGQR
jgi:hypothetical protein